MIDFIVDVQSIATELDLLECLINSFLFERVQKEALSSPKSMLNLIEYLRINQPSVFGLVLSHPTVFKLVLYGYAIVRTDDESSNPFYRDKFIHIIMDKNDEDAIDNVF